MTVRSPLWLGLGLLLAGASALADEASVCKPLDRTPSCCPHPPPQCCAPEVSEPLDEAGVAQICTGVTAKGEHAGIGACFRYFARGDRTGEVQFSRESGDAAAFEKRKVALLSPSSRVSAATVPQAQRAFVLRELDEKGVVERSAIWALVGREIVHVGAETEACNEDQVMRLLHRAIERMRVLPTRPHS